MANLLTLAASVALPVLLLLLASPLVWLLERMED